MRQAFAITVALSLLAAPIVPHLGHDCECAKRELRAVGDDCCAKAQRPPHVANKAASKASPHDVARHPCNCCGTNTVGSAPALASDAQLTLPGPAWARVLRDADLPAPPSSQLSASVHRSRAPPGKSNLPLLNCSLLI